MSDIDIAQLSVFIAEGASLRARSGEVPIPVEDHNDWVARMNEYFEQCGKPEYKVRLSDFTGMTFYGDGSDKSQFKKSIDGHVGRLHEFLGELSTGSSKHGDDVLVLKPNFFGLGIDLRAGWTNIFGRKKEKKGDA